MTYTCSKEHAYETPGRLELQALVIDEPAKENVNRVTAVVKELTQGTLLLRSARLLAVDSIQRLVHEEAESGPNVRPHGKLFLEARILG